MPAVLPGLLAPWVNREGGRRVVHAARPRSARQGAGYSTTLLGVVPGPVGAPVSLMTWSMMPS